VPSVACPDSRIHPSERSGTRGVQRLHKALPCRADTTQLSQLLVAWRLRSEGFPSNAEADKHLGVSVYLSTFKWTFGFAELTYARTTPRRTRNGGSFNRHT